ncbi:2-hydroxyacid dehydrogenase [Runella sp. MFBS21]|uniref:2-hydroxyacid dehydrogenase n=1 Tax=Runella sp. MFBS21 TaxID=3034018 RepID=UPI0023F79010|nr:2-hydroxyacid dehydrogenase [Runella sp. MFBS21]MDF7819113.1 2-hydroxyacid dehydrogenase [Runella sp. MFBS21]
MKVSFFSTKSYDRDFFERFNTSHEIIFFDTHLSLESALLAKGSDAVCVFVNDQLTSEIIYKLHELGIKIIALRCAGFNNVVLDTAQKLGIAVVRVPAYSPQAVAEHAVALIMTLNRKTHKAYNRVREGNFSLERLTGFDIYGKTIGVIGTGKIGNAFARIMLGFGCKVLAHDLYPSADLEALGVSYVSQNELLSSCHIISLHCPLTPETQHLISTDTLRLMKHNAMLINTSRGGLVNTKAVINALKTGQLGYLGIDVYEQEADLFFKDLSEYVIQDDMLLRLMSFPNVLITAHQGFFTEEALSEIAKVTLQNLSDFESGNLNPATTLVGG